ncbi:MAG: alpha/beta fold hydrolase [Acidobacteriia bacterium]|nr:alpha/beta fold hydrolase [Terriglobia bacterium]
MKEEGWSKRAFVGVIVSITLSALCLQTGWAQKEIPPNSYLLKLVVTDTSGKSVADADVILDEATVGITDETGLFILLRKPFPSGAHKLVVSRLGFVSERKSIELPSDATKPGLSLEIQLKEESPSVKQKYTVRGTSGGEKPNYQVVQIFYATDRKDTGTKDVELRYANERSAGELERGTCEVSIPRDHRMGEVESPSLMRLEFRPDPNKHIVLQSIDALPTDTFYQKLNSKVERSSQREVMVFIHGYNVGFEKAARNTAQLAYDLGFDGAPILYSWPSRNRMLAYTEDEDTIQWTAFHLRAFLEELAARTHAAKIHVIAHSLGNRALLSALQVMAAEHHDAKKPIFDQVILAAPDIGADTFQLMAKEIEPITRRITLYASANDNALLLSQIMHGAMRAGEGKYLLITPGVDTVDASAVKTEFLGHLYYGTSDSIISDIRQILLKEAPPGKRHLLPAMWLNKLPYWIVPTPKPRNSEAGELN